MGSFLCGPKLSVAPVLQSLASQVMKNLIVAQFGVINDHQALSTINQASDQLKGRITYGHWLMEGNFYLSLVVNGVNRTVWSANFGKNPAIYLTSPRKL